MSKQNEPIQAAQALMTEFATLTGLSSDAPPRRYLWTDAFAVCNFLELYRQTNDEEYKALALRLVKQVHHVLGRYREDDPRTGWISGLDEAAGEAHPTRGGLRIGKNLPERKPNERYNERLEWERDGQYYHYLTKWMQALNHTSQVTGDLTYNLWARELVEVIHTAFVYQPRAAGQKRMYWKMSTDLSYPFVPSMGHHDPLDGYLTYSELDATAANLEGDEHVTGPDLQAEIADLASIGSGKSWVTDDPLGLGGLLTGAYRAAQLVAGDRHNQSDLPAALLADSLRGLATYSQDFSWQLPAEYRLAFRELGLAIGLHAIEKLRDFVAEKGGHFSHLVKPLEILRQYIPLAEIIETFWLAPVNRRANSWTSHLGINMVMLATSLAPDGYLAGR